MTSGGFVPHIDFATSQKRIDQPVKCPKPHEPQRRAVHQVLVMSIT
ncbi:hypothetical protein [Marivivens aquimaris]|nr:hypothetical protein [Marivivens aquimaris]